jgi:DNA-damage-inducible protein D
MMSQTPHVSPFEQIRKINEHGMEYWSARDLAKILGYRDFRNFQDVLKKAKVSCEESEQAIADHFGDVTDMITVGKGAQRRIHDTHLTRYACYLVVMNGSASLQMFHKNSNQ